MNLKSSQSLTNHARCVVSNELKPSVVSSPRIFIARLPDRVGVKAMSSGELSSGRPGVELFENRNDLCLGEVTFLRVSSPWACSGVNEFLVAQRSRAYYTAERHCDQ